MGRVCCVHTCLYLNPVCVCQCLIVSQTLVITCHLICLSVCLLLLCVCVCAAVSDGHTSLRAKVCVWAVEVVAILLWLLCAPLLCVQN